jgi:hypothetical protein
MPPVLERVAQKTLATDYFAEALELTGDIRFALNATAVHVAIGVANEWPSDDPAELLAKWGIEREYWQAMFSIPDRAARTAIPPVIFRLIIEEPGSIVDIPSSDCIGQHLPKNRRPTREEIDRAIEKCRKQ